MKQYKKIDIYILNQKTKGFDYRVTTTAYKNLTEARTCYSTGKNIPFERVKTCYATESNVPKTKGKIRQYKILYTKVKHCECIVEATSRAGAIKQVVSIKPTTELKPFRKKDYKVIDAMRYINHIELDKGK